MPYRVQSCASACLLCAMLSHQVFAQTIVSTESGYAAALANPGVTHVRIAQGSVISVLPVPAQYAPVTTSPWTLDGEIAADGSLPVFDGQGQARRALSIESSSFGNIYTLDTVRNLVFRNSVLPANYGSAAGFHFLGEVRNGVVNVHFENNTTLSPSAAGAMLIGSANRSVSGGIHASSFTGNSGGSVGGVYVFSDFRGGIHDTSFTNNRGRGTGGFRAANFRDGIYSSVFTANQATIGNGGGMRVSNFDGGVHGSDFIGNAAISSPSTSFSGMGGGVYVDRDSHGGIHPLGSQASRFIGNVAGRDGGGLFVGRDFHDDMDGQTTFTDNRAELGRGGAVAINGRLYGSIRDSGFTGNRAGTMGGALYLGSTTGGVYDSRWIGNTAAPAATAATTSGLGGAVYVRDAVILQNNLFLGNAARTNTPLDTAGGRGGALFHDRSLANATYATVTIAARGGNTAVFYGNVHNQGATGDAYNAVHFGNTLSAGNNRQTHIVIHADTPADDVLMFDPLSAQADGVVDITNAARANLATTLAKTGTGNWFLGGVSRMRGDSAWSIDDGTLHLVTVDDGTGAVDAGINLSGSVSSFTLNASANLEGSGSIAAKDIKLSGYLSPNVQRNDGVKVSEITAATTADDVRGAGFPVWPAAL